MSDDRLQSDISRGQRATALLSDDILSGAFDTLRSEYMKAWEATSFRDTEARERLWQAVQIIGKVKSHIASVVASGNFAQAELNQIRMGLRDRPAA